MGKQIDGNKNIMASVKQTKRELTVQGRIERELYDHLIGLPNFDEVGMSAYIRRALIQRSKFKKSDSHTVK